jgi:hypothetical protein
VTLAATSTVKILQQIQHGTPTHNDLYCRNGDQRATDNKTGTNKTTDIAHNVMPEFFA